MKKIVSTLIVGLMTASAFAATPAEPVAAATTKTAEAKPAVAVAKTEVAAKKEKGHKVLKKHKEAAAATTAPAVK